jgi:hypothetical protein
MEPVFSIGMFVGCLGVDREDRIKRSDVTFTSKTKRKRKAGKYMQRHSVDELRNSLSVESHRLVTVRTLECRTSHRSLVIWVLI